MLCFIFSPSAVLFIPTNDLIKWFWKKTTSPFPTIFSVHCTFAFGGLELRAFVCVRAEYTIVTVIVLCLPMSFDFSCRCWHINFSTSTTISDTWFGEGWIQISFFFLFGYACFLCDVKTSVLVGCLWLVKYLLQMELILFFLSSATSSSCFALNPHWLWFYNNITISIDFGKVAFSSRWIFQFYPNVVLSMCMCDYGWIFYYSIEICDFSAGDWHCCRCYCHCSYPKIFCL